MYCLRNVLLGCLVLFAGMNVAADQRGITVQAAAKAGMDGYDPSQFHALIIGINTYPDPAWPDLLCARNDAAALADVLQEYYGYSPENMKVLLDEQATQRSILEALDSFSGLSEDDSLLIFYAGHGWMDETLNNGYWVPSDASSSKFSYVSNGQIMSEYFKKLKVKHLLVISDSCFAGAMLRTRGLARTKDWELPKGFRKTSRWVMTSGDLKPVEDDSGNGHSPFTTRVLQYLKYGDKDAFGINDLYVYVRQTLPTDAIATPLQTIQHMPGGEYAFARLSPKPPPPGQPDNLDSPAVVEVDSPDDIVVDARSAVVTVGDGDVVAVASEPVLLMVDDIARPKEPVIPPPAPKEPEKTKPVGNHDFSVSNLGMEMVWSEVSKMWIGKYEVTNAQFRQFRPSHDSGSIAAYDFNGDQQPVLYVSQRDASEFAAWLTEREKKSGRLPSGFTYRLPSEAEWRISICGVGSSATFPWGSAWPPPNGNFADTQARKGLGMASIRGYDDGCIVTCPVQESGKNDLGIYGAYGNAHEWTSTVVAGEAQLVGGAWDDGNRAVLELKKKLMAPVGERQYGFGFRVILAR